MLRSWKNKFDFRKFAPIHSDPNIFISSQWQRNKTDPNLIYLIYRTAVMLFFFITWVITIVRESGKGKWPIFLTNWGYTTNTVQATLAFIMLFFSYIGSTCNKPKIKESVLSLYSVYWVAYNVASSTGLVISVIYWTVIFDANKIALDALNFFVHGNNSILILIDVCIIAHPFIMWHVIYPVMLGTIYSIFTIIYYAAGGTGKEGRPFIYKIVNWDKPGMTLGVCLGVLIFVIIIHSLMVLITAARQKLEKKLRSKKLDITVETKKQEAAYVNEAMTDVV
ncbi:unnamed protein product [Phyllotreta striolata]|uniref:Protein rolling stone n=1 Tax=Phyllotreta striolata TaxID=444603 RepID=A0A9N9XK81_PHYSR|nr:unnamed protein product [Phyllotreta striolata]